MEPTSENQLVDFRKRAAFVIWDSELNQIVQYLRDPNQSQALTSNKDFQKLTDVIYLPNGIDKYRSKWLVRRMNVLSDRFESDATRKKNIQARFNWLFYQILVVDGVVLTDMALVLVYKKNITQICFGEPKKIEYVCYLDKGFLENKQQPGKSCEYSVEQDKLIADFLETLLKEYEEQKKLEIVNKTREMQRDREQEVVDTKKKIVDAVTTLNVLREQEMSLDDKLDEAQLHEEALLKRKQERNQKKQQQNAQQQGTQQHPSAPPPDTQYPYMYQQNR